MSHLPLPRCLLGWLSPETRKLNFQECPSSFGIPDLLPFCPSPRDSVRMSSAKPGRRSLTLTNTRAASLAQAERKSSQLMPLAPPPRSCSGYRGHLPVCPPHLPSTGLTPGGLFHLHRYHLTAASLVHSPRLQMSDSPSISWHGTQAVLSTKKAWGNASDIVSRDRSPSSQP